MPTVVVHGGAGGGDLPPEVQAARAAGLDRAVAAARVALEEGRDALDAAVAAVEILEDDSQFNAGTGSVLNAAGEVEMDASVMASDGTGAGVAVVRGIRHPVRLALQVARETDHLLVAGRGAERLARLWGYPAHDPVTADRRAHFDAIQAAVVAGAGVGANAALSQWTVRTPVLARRLLNGEGRHGTVGAVVLDAAGRMAAATSTGGIWFKMPGRVGDSPILGAGTWAVPHAGASATGHGEGILRRSLTRAFAEAVEGGRSAPEAAEWVVEAARAAGTECGLVGIDGNGVPAAWTNTRTMPTAQARW